MARLTALDRLGLPVYQAVRPASRNLSVSQGKGFTAAAARVGAAMEALENWHAECFDPVPQVITSVREMAYANPIRTRDLHWLPAGACLVDWPIPWVEARSLVDGGRAWLPRAMLELDFRLARAFTPALFHRTSNGLASGNSREEALVHALSELVERYTIYTVHRGPGRRVALDPDSMTAPYARELVERIRRAGFRLAIWDLTGALGLPVISAEIVGDDLPRVWFGSGSHPAPDVAVSRALTEAAQARLTYISGARDDLALALRPPSPYVAFEDFREPEPERAFGELPDVAGAEVTEDLELLVERLAAAGYPPYSVDLTRPELGVPVVRVFAPGLAEAYHV